MLKTISEKMDNVQVIRVYEELDNNSYTNGVYKIKKENFINNLQEASQVIFEQNGATPVQIEGHRTYTIKDVVQMFLLSYKYQRRIDYLVITDNPIFDEVKQSLNTILSLKQSLGNDSEKLKEHLLTFYKMFNPTIQEIIDNTYPHSYEGKTVVIVDNHNFFYRNFHGMPDMRDSQNRPTNIIKALTYLIKDIEKQNPDYVIFADEGTKDKCFRKVLYSEYKANRSETPADLAVQIPICIDLIKQMGFTVASVEGYEADDIIASYAKAYANLGAKVKIITSDKDLFQLVNDKISIYNPLKQAEVTTEDCIKKFGVGFDRCLMAQAIIGDTSDNVPGIKGIGAKGAAELITQYGNLDNLYQHADEIKGKKGEYVRNSKSEAYTSLLLVSLYDHLADENVIKTSTMPTNPIQKIINRLNSFEIRV